MRSFDWSNIEASNDGEFTPLPAGGYVAKIINMVDKEQKEYVELIYDIAEGKHAGYYSDDFGQKHPYTHHLFMSYKQTALGMLKGRLEAIQKSNPGFDPFAAWDAGRLDMFNNRLIGINLQEEEYLNRDNEVRTRLNVCQVVNAQDVRDGKVKVRPKKELQGKAPVQSQSSAADVADDFEIPFD